MILVTGGTGFIGQALIRRLVSEGHSVRTLLRPGNRNPNLPKGISIEVAISNIRDAKNLRSALINVKTVFHLVSGSWQSETDDLSLSDIAGIRNLLVAGKDAGIERIVFVSHLGADRGSAFPVLKAKGIVEELIKNSGIDYTIIRSALVYGPDDNFTTDIVKLVSFFPLLFFLPGEQPNLIQPIFIDDLVTCLIWSLDIPELRNQLISIGGPENLTIKTVIKQILNKMGIKRNFLYVQPALLRFIVIFLSYVFRNTPLSNYWLDYLAVPRTTDIDSISRQFGLLPTLFSQNLAYLSKYKKK
jgi:uncharacterized protein YbjT (DUF2867 family)